MATTNSLGSSTAGSGGRLWAWYLFPFGTSIVVFNGGLYFPQWLVVDNHVSDIWFNLSLVVTTILLLASAPVLGIWSDRQYGRVYFLKILSVAMFLGMTAIFGADKLLAPGPLKAVVALVAFVVILYSYQLSLVFHNALLARVATSENYDRVSGIGIAWGWIGAIVGILATLPFVEGLVPFVAPGRSQAFFPSAALFALCGVVSLAAMPDELPTAASREVIRTRQAYALLWKDLRGIQWRSALGIFLIAYLIYSDAVLTVQDNSTIYLEQVLHLSDMSKAILYLELLVMGAVGAVATAWVTRYVSRSKLLFGVLIGWFIALIGVVLSTNKVLVFVVFAAVGLLFGALMNLSRVIYIRLVPAERRAELFGIYAVFERSASLLGPLVWSAPIVLLPGMGAGRYRLAMFSMALLVGIASILAWRLVRKNVI